ncbi:hypothetical protein ACFLYU_03530 [Candidatus Dependentiae bacterium]
MIKKITLYASFCCLALATKNTFTMQKQKETNNITSKNQLLCEAITKKNKQEIKKLLKSGTNPNTYYETNGKNFESMANRRGIKNCKKLLIPIIIIATAKSDLETIKLLVKYGAKASASLKFKTKNNIQDSDMSALFFVNNRKNRKKEIWQYLLKCEKKES